MNKFLMLAGTLLFAGCATSPSMIKPTKADATKYSNVACGDLLAALYKTNDTIAPLMARQQKTSTNDELGMFLIGVPTGSMSDKEDVNLRQREIARLKGEMEAIEFTRKAKRCP